jgi:hypothetical protein
MTGTADRGNGRTHLLCALSAVGGAQRNVISGSGFAGVRSALPGERDPAT